MNRRVASEKMKTRRERPAPARARLVIITIDALIHVDEKHGGELSKRRGGEGSYDLPGARVGGERRGRGQVFVRSGQSRGAFGTGGKNCKEGTRSSKSSSHSAASGLRESPPRSSQRSRALSSSHVAQRLRGRAGGETGTHLRRRGRPRPGYFLAIRGIAGLARTVGSVVARGRSASRCGLRERVCRNVPRRGAEVHLAVDVDANGGGLDARGFALSLTLERRGSASGLHVDETERGRRGRGDTRATSRPSRDALTNGRRGKKCVRVRVTAHDLVRTSPCRFCVRCRNASGYLDSR